MESIKKEQETVGAVSSSGVNNLQHNNNTNLTKCQAITKLDSEYANAKLSKKGSAVGGSVVETLKDFCIQNEEFSQAVVQGKSVAEEGKIKQCRGYKNNVISNGGEEKPQEIKDFENEYQQYLDKIFAKKKERKTA